MQLKFSQSSNTISFGSIKIPCDPETVSLVCKRHLVSRFSAFLGEVIQDLGKKSRIFSFEGVLDKEQYQQVYQVKAMLRRMKQNLMGPYGQLLRINSIQMIIQFQRITYLQHRRILPQTHLTTVDNWQMKLLVRWITRILPTIYRQIIRILIIKVQIRR